MSDSAHDAPPPDLTAEDLERGRAWKRRIEAELAANPPAPGFEELVLAALREQTDLLREIRDALQMIAPQRLL